MPVTQTTEMPATTTRLTGIDGVRGVAIFMVIAGHLIGFAGLLGRSEVYSELFKTPLHVLWDERAAVQIFFVLSGFVLQRGVHRQISSTLAYRFLITRFFRLYPLYAIALAFALGCRALWAGHGQLTAFNPELGIFWDRPVGVGEAIAEIIPIFPVNQISNINAVIWSIFVEFKFSLVFPIIALSVVHRGQDRVFLAASDWHVLVFMDVSAGFCRTLSVPFRIGSSSGQDCAKMERCWPKALERCWGSSFYMAIRTPVYQLCSQSRTGSF